MKLYKTSMVLDSVQQSVKRTLCNAIVSNEIRPLGLPRLTDNLFSDTKSLLSH